MSESCVTVKISNNNGFILNESSSPVLKNDLKELIAVVRETQQKTNDCLTELVKETGLAASAELEKSDISDQEFDDSDSEADDIEIQLPADTEADVSPKRAKLKN